MEFLKWLQELRTPFLDGCVWPLSFRRLNKLSGGTGKTNK